MGEHLRETFHEAACISDDPNEVCDLCGTTQDRAIHDKVYADENGHPWVPLDADHGGPSDG